MQVKQKDAKTTASESTIETKKQPQVEKTSNNPKLREQRKSVKSFERKIRKVADEVSGSNVEEVIEVVISRNAEEEQSVDDQCSCGGKCQQSQDSSVAEQEEHEGTQNESAASQEKESSRGKPIRGQPKRAKDKTYTTPSKQKLSSRGDRLFDQILNSDNQQEEEGEGSVNVSHEEIPIEEGVVCEED